MCDKTIPENVGRDDNNAGETSPTPATIETCGMKDPKNVEAGRRCAAARKAKKEKLLAELRGSKAAMRQPSEPREPLENPEIIADKADTVTRSPGPTQRTSYIHGGLGIAGVYGNCPMSRSAQRWLEQGQQRPNPQFQMRQLEQRLRN